MISLLLAVLIRIKFISVPLLALCLWVITSVNSFAQQDPHYTQYRYNLSVVNPAYAGSQGLLSANLLYRNQWSGLEGAPETYTFSAHSPFGEESGLGLSAIRDRLGPVQETNVYADYSYTLQLGRDQYLALGLKAGATFHDVGLTELEVVDPLDPFFSQDISKVYPNFGIGAYYFTDNYFISLSVPNLLTSVHLDENGLRYGNERNHMFIAGGYLFVISDDLSLRPSAMLKGTFRSPWTFDLNFNVLIVNTVEGGVSYRLNDSFSGLVGIWVSDVMRIGYAYDAVVSPISNVGGASHEIILTFDIVFGDGGRVIPPRFL